MAGHVCQLVGDSDRSSVRVVGRDSDEESALYLYGDLRGTIDAGLQREDAVRPYVEAVQQRGGYDCKLGPSVTNSRFLSGSAKCVASISESW